jgi:hypothetical protein
MPLYVINVANPPAGQDWQYTVPGQYIEDVVSVQCTLTTTGNPTTAADSSGNGRNMTYEPTNPGLTWGTAGPWGSAPNNATGDTDHTHLQHAYTIRVPNTDLNTTNVTVGAWVYIDTPAFGYQDIFAAADIDLSGNFRGYVLRYLNSTRVFELRGSSAQFVQSTGGILGNAWHHVAATYDGANTRFYIDGALDSTVAGVLPFTSNSVGASIGGATQHQLLNDVWTGRLAGVFVTNTVLSGANIATIAAANASAAGYVTTVNGFSPLGLWMLDETLGTFGRTPNLEITNGQSNVGMYTPGFPAAATPSPYNYTWMTGLAAHSSVVSDTIITAAIPDLILPAGYTLGTFTPDIQPTDQWSNIVIWWNSDYMDYVHNAQRYDFIGACLEYHQVGTL